MPTNGFHHLNSSSLSRRLTIGVMINNVDEDYQRIIWSGIEEAAKEADANVINFLSGDLNPADSATLLRNNILSLISPESLDGLIVVSTVMATHIGNDRLREYCRRYEPLPMVSLGFRLEEMTNVLVDNQFGLQQIMNHLIEDHGYRKFLFIGGTLNNSDAVERHRIFVESLKSHSIPLNTECDTRGDFRQQKAYDIVSDALDKKLEFEAIVAANDEMAIAAMRALQDRSIAVPDRIAVTGFDDIIRARYLAVPLTTVRQPTFEISKRATEILLKKIRKESTRDLELFGTELMIRRSCGCFSHEAVKAGILEAKPRDGVITEAFSEIKNVVIREMEMDCTISLKNSSDLFETVMDAFFYELHDNACENHFLSIMERTLQESALRGIDDSVWGNFISILRKLVLPYSASQYLCKEKAENMLHQSRVMIKDAAKQVQSGIRFQLAHKTQTLQFVIDALISSFDVPTLLNNLAQQLPLIGIKSCYLSVHASVEKKYEEACLLLAYNKDGRIVLGKDGCVFPAKQLFPHELVNPESRYNIIIQPLVFRDEEMGFIGLELNPIEEISSLALAEQIRSAFKASIMMQEIIEKDRKLSDLDRMKNDFIANITHDFRSPLTVISNVADLSIRFNKNISEEEKEKYSIIYKSSLRLKNTIDKLLELAKIDAKGIKLKIEKIDLASYLHTLVDYYISSVMSSGIKIIKKLPVHVTEDFYTDIEKLEEILDNILSNAIKFVDPNTGVITTELEEDETFVFIRMSDNGIGIPKDKLEMIFNRFEQAHAGRNSAYRGTGIGLAFAKQLTAFLKGELWAESEGEGKGSRFILKLKKGRKHFAEKEITDEESVMKKREDKKILVEAELEEKMHQESVQTVFTDLNQEGESDYRKGIILIIDDDRNIREIIKKYLNNNGFKNFITAPDGKQGLEAVYEYFPDIIICDYNMPNMKGDELHNQLVGNPKYREIPYIFLSAIYNENLIMERREIGAVAYLKKPIEEKMLIIIVGEQLKKYYEFKKITQMATIDELTGLNNHRAIVEHLKRELLMREFRDFSLLFFDVDHFKEINDDYGHQAGDLVLSTIGHITKGTIRKYDLAGRYGGDEFIVLLPETNLNNALHIADGLRKAILKRKIIYHNKVLLVSSSFGVASLIDNSKYIEKALGIEKLEEIYYIKNSDKADWKEIEKQKEKISEILLKMADEVLYQSKKTVCQKCGFSSEKKNAFTGNQCPECGSLDLMSGRNKVTGFK